MNIGIIVYSQTGNTYSVATRLQRELLKKGYKVIIERIEVEGNEQPRKNPFKLKNIPKIDKYDLVIFGSLVEAFSLSPVMKTYLNQLPVTDNKKISCFVTQFFPYPWMGGNKAIKQMKKICNDRKLEVIETAVINWSNKKRLLMIEEAINKIINSIK